MRICVRCGTTLDGRAWYCSACGWQAGQRRGIHDVIGATRPASEAFTARQAQNVASIDPGHFWFAARNQLITWAVARYAPGARALLEVGCGTGHVLRALRDARSDLHLTGVEPSMESLVLASTAAPGAELLFADTRSLPYVDEFDVVGAFDVLEHIPNDLDALHAIVRAARPGGLVILTVPQHPALWSPIDDYSGHQRRYTRRGLIALARDAGLDVVRVTSFVSLLLPGLVASRFAQRKIAVAPGREFAVSARVNSAAMTIMRAELALIRAGIPLPAGGSLLLVARRP